MNEGRGKREEGRGKREEGRRKREEGRGKKEVQVQGCKLKVKDLDFEL
jgi:hypothetical protein